MAEMVGEQGSAKADLKMIIRDYTSNDKSRWNAFVDRTADGSVFHRTEWKEIIEDTFHYQSYYLLAETGNQIVGLLPLFHTKSIIGGNALISSPFAVYGGVLALDETVSMALIAESMKLAERLNVPYAEFRHQTTIAGSALQSSPSLYFTYINPLPENEDEILPGLPREARRMVRKGVKNGLNTKIENDKVDQFHHLYALSVRKFGTPVFPKKLFALCLQKFKENADILFVYSDDKPIAAVLSFYYKNGVFPYYAGMAPDAKALAPNNLMYFSLMQHAHQRGCRTFDFGRSKSGTGASKFKEHMGFEPISLHYQYVLRNGDQLPNNNPTNPKFQLALNVWKRLPLAVTKIVGPRLVRHFP